MPISVELVIFECADQLVIYKAFFLIFRTKLFLLKYFPFPFIFKNVTVNLKRKVGKTKLKVKFLLFQTINVELKMHTKYFGGHYDYFKNCHIYES